MIAVARRPVREYVDFSAVPPSQWAMHDRLENWAKWCRGGDRQAGSAASPMFALYRSTDARRAYGDETTVPLDRLDAMHVAKGVAALPGKHRRAVQWCYLHPRNPANMARELAVSLEGMAMLIRNARSMLMNRDI